VPAKPSPTPALVWLRPTQAPLLASIARIANLRVIAAGAPPAEARSAPTAFDADESFTDLRSALATTEAGLILFLTAPDAEPLANPADQSPIADLELIRLCHARNATLLSLEPIPASASDIPLLTLGPTGESARRNPMIPLLTQTKVFADALEAIASLGQPRTVSLSFWSGPGEGSLGARLFDAAQVIHALLGPPDTIDASVVTRVSRSGVRMAPGETLRNLRGDMTANLRFAGAKAAALTLSDRGGRWFRGASIVNDAGRIRLDESGFEPIDAAGAPPAAPPPRRPRAPPRRPTTPPPRAPPPRRAPTPTPSPNHPDAHPPGLDQRRRKTPDSAPPPTGEPGAAPAIASAILRALDPHAPRPAPIDLASVLATCEAALLSARTGQPESPATILRMAQAR